MKFAYRIKRLWRIVVYRRILCNPYLSRYAKWYLDISDRLLGLLVTALYPNREFMRTSMARWKAQTSAIFSPEITPLAVYAKSTTEAKVALESIEFGSNGKLLFISHGAYKIQNVCSVLMEISARSKEPYTTVLIFRRQYYPHVEDFWRDYSLCFKVNIEVVHNDTLALIQRTKELLAAGQVVLCAPDFFFSEEISYEAASLNCMKTVELYLRIARYKKADVFYVKCCSLADYTSSRSFLEIVDNYDSGAVQDMFFREIEQKPENWFFTINHYIEMQTAINSSVVSTR